MKRFEVIVVGGGPAGLAAARQLLDAGIRDILVLERETEAGGVPRHCHHPGFGFAHLRRPLTGPAYAARLREAVAPVIRTRACVLALKPRGEITVAEPERGIVEYRARAVLLATGARETPRPPRFVSGDRPNGVLTTGALQQFLHLGAIRPFERALVVGSEYVALSALWTMRRAGIRPLALIEPGKHPLAPSMLVRTVCGLLRVPLLLETEIETIRGGEKVEEVLVRGRHGRRRFRCDGVLFTGRFVPEASLVEASHLDLDPATGGPLIDQHWRCSDPAYFAAGNLLRPIETAGIAAREGIEAARAILRHLEGRLPAAERMVEIRFDSPVRYVYPRRLAVPGGPLSPLQLRARVERPFEGSLVLLRNGEEIWRERGSWAPERRIRLPGHRLELAGLERIELRAEPAGRARSHPRAVAPPGREAVGREVTPMSTSNQKRTSTGSVLGTGLKRRDFLIGTAGTAAMGATLVAAPHVRRAEAATLELRWLGWEHYNVKSLAAEFEKRYKVKVSAGFFDGNSEAYNKLRAGGTADFDLVMADGFWPRLYARQGLTQPIDEGKLDLSNVFPDFLPPHYELLHEEGGGRRIAAPNCWGGYGLTVNTAKIAPEDQETLELLYNEKYKGHLSTSARFEENIAITGILVAHRMGTIDAERPDGKPFNPYVLTDAELEEAKKLLIEQKRLLVTRWNDEDTLERLFRAQVVWCSPEWSGIYRRIRFDELDGKTNLKMRHVLRPKEGGLGWVDTWCITSGVTDSEKLELCHHWINFRLERESMKTVAMEIGWAPTVDVRDMLPERYVETLFLNETSAIRGLYQFDAPSSPEKWQRVWAEVEAA